MSSPCVNEHADVVYFYYISLEDLHDYDSSLYKITKQNNNQKVLISLIDHMVTTLNKSKGQTSLSQLS
jgi:hypothetical protein